MDAQASSYAPVSPRTTAGTHMVGPSAPRPRVASRRRPTRASLPRLFPTTSPPHRRHRTIRLAHRAPLCRRATGFSSRPSGSLLGNRPEHRVELCEDVIVRGLLAVAVVAGRLLRGRGLVLGAPGSVGKLEVAPAALEPRVLHGGREADELLLVGPAQAGLPLLVGGGRLQGEDGPLRERPRLLVRPVGGGVDVDVLVLQLLGLLLALVIPQ